MKIKYYKFTWNDGSYRLYKVEVFRLYVYDKEERVWFYSNFKSLEEIEKSSNIKSIELTEDELFIEML